MPIAPLSQTWTNLIALVTIRRVPPRGAGQLNPTRGLGKPTAGAAPTIGRGTAGQRNKSFRKTARDFLRSNMHHTAVNMAARYIEAQATGDYSRLPEGLQPDRTGLVPHTPISDPDLFTRQQELINEALLRAS